MFTELLHQMLDVIFQPRLGIGKLCFHILSQFTPMVNVEVFLIDGAKKAIYLVYRDDELYGPGWHVPGAILRVQELLLDCVKRTIRDEICSVEYDAENIICILATQAFHRSRLIRSHFISFCYLVQVKWSQEILEYNHKQRYLHGHIAKHYKCPSNLIKEHKKFIPLINCILKGEKSREYDILVSDEANECDKC